MEVVKILELVTREAVSICVKPKGRMYEEPGMLLGPMALLNQSEYCYLDSCRSGKGTYLQAYQPSLASAVDLLIVPY